MQPSSRVRDSNERHTLGGARTYVWFMTRLYNVDYYNDVSIHYKLIQAFAEYRQAMRNYCIYSLAWSFANRHDRWACGVSARRESRQGWTGNPAESLIKKKKALPGTRSMDDTWFPFHFELFGIAESIHGWSKVTRSLARPSSRVCYRNILYDYSTLKSRDISALKSRVTFGDLVRDVTSAVRSHFVREHSCVPGEIKSDPRSWSTRAWFTRQNGDFRGKKRLRSYSEQRRVARAPNNYRRYTWLPLWEISPSANSLERAAGPGTTRASRTRTNNFLGNQRAGNLTNRRVPATSLTSRPWLVSWCDWGVTFRPWRGSAPRGSPPGRDPPGPRGNYE